MRKKKKVVDFVLDLSSVDYNYPTKHLSFFFLFCLALSCKTPQKVVDEGFVENASDKLSTDLVKLKSESAFPKTAIVASINDPV